MCVYMCVFVLVCVCVCMYKRLKSWNQDDAMLKEVLETLVAPGEVWLTGWIGQIWWALYLISIVIPVNFNISLHLQTVYTSYVPGVGYRYRRPRGCITLRQRIRVVTTLGVYLRYAMCSKRRVTDSHSSSSGFKCFPEFSTTLNCFQEEVVVVRLRPIFRTLTKYSCENAQ